MKFLKQSFVALFAFLLIESAFMQGHYLPDPSLIYELCEEELKQILKNDTPTVIIGHMNHCSHCGKVLKFAQTLPSKYPKINFFSVNGPETTLHKKVDELSKSKFRIPGYPSIVYVKDGEIKHLQIGGNEKTFEENIKKYL